jgi:hypothetical protein
MAYRQYLTSADITPAMTSYIAKCEVYQAQTTLVLQSGDSYEGLLQGGVDLADTFTAALVQRYKTLYSLMSSMGLPVGSATLPTTVDQDATVRGAAAWNIMETYVGLFGLLVGKLQTAVVAKVDAAATTAAVRNATQSIASASKSGSNAGVVAAKQNLASAKAPTASVGAAALTSVSSKVVGSSKGIATVPTAVGGAASTAGGAAVGASRGVAALVGRSAAAAAAVAKAPTPATQGRPTTQGGAQGGSQGGQGQPVRSPASTATGSSGQGSGRPV